MRRISIFLALCALGALPVRAQDLGSDDIVVVKDYAARIQDAERIERAPSLPPEDFDSLQVDYDDLPDIDLALRPEPHETRPLATPREVRADLRESYIRFGFGTQFTPLVDAAWFDSDIDDMLYGVRYRHLSGHGRRENQRFADHRVDAFWEYAPGPMKLEVETAYDFGKDFFWGYDEDVETFDRADIRQAVHDLELRIGLGNAVRTDRDIDYGFDITTRYTADAYDQTEWMVRTDAFIAKTWSEMHRLEVGGTADLNNFVPSYTNDKEREIFHVRTRYVFDNGDWRLRAGAETVFGDVSNEETWNIYPEIYTEKPLLQDHLIFYSGWRRYLQKNTYRGFLQDNPWMNTVLEIDNSRIEDRMAGFTGAVGGFQYDARFSNKVVREMPLFVNDSADMKRFNVVYEDRMTVFNLSVEASYTFERSWTISTTQNIFLYELDEQAEAWHQPTYRGTLTGSYDWRDKLLFSASVTGIAGVKARRADGSTRTIPGTADISIGVEYMFTDYLSFFCHLNNLAAIRYETFHRYPGFGFNGLVGATVKF